MQSCGLGIPAALAGWWLMPLLAPVSNPGTAEPSHHAAAADLGTDTELAGRLAAARGTKGRWNAMRAAITLARAIPPEQRLQWLRSGRFQHSDPLVVKTFSAELGRIAFNDNPAAFIAADLGAYRPDYGPYLNELAKRDPLAVAELARTMENDAVRNVCLNAAAINLAESNPDELFRVVREMPSPDKSLVRHLVKAARGDSDHLLALAEGCGDRSRLLMRQAAVSMMCEKDLRGTLRWIDEQEDADGLFDILCWWPGDRLEFNKKLAQLLPELPDGWLNRPSPNGMSGHSNLLASMFSIGAEEAWLETDLKRLGIDSDSIRYLNRELVGKMGLRNPEAAAAYYMDETVISPKDRSFVAHNWSIIASNARVKLPAPLHAVLDEPSRDVAEANLGLREPKPPPSVAEQLNEACADNYYGFNVHDMKDWNADQLAEVKAWADGLKDERIERVAKHISSGSDLPPEVHDEIIARAIKLGAMTPKTVCYWLDEISKDAYADPPAVARRVVALPESPQRSYAIRNIALRWNELAPDEAARWITSLAGGDRTAAEEAIKRAETWKPDSPEED